MQSLIRKFSQYTHLKIDLNICQSKSRFLKVQKKRNQIIFFLDPVFLSAPDSVVKALVEYAKNKRSQDIIIIKKFVYEKQSELDLSHTLDKQKLNTKGKYFDLKEIYSRVNHTYFQNQMDLEISWFYPRYKTYRHITFGQYDRYFKLIKINHYLDSESTPSFFMEQLIFHEMLHEKCPPYIDEKGRYRIHTKEFKELEKTHPFLQQSKSWGKQFLKEFGRIHGRT